MTSNAHKIPPSGRVCSGEADSPAGQGPSARRWQPRWPGHETSPDSSGLDIFHPVRYFSWFESESFSFLKWKMGQARPALLSPLVLLSRQGCAPQSCLMVKMETVDFLGGPVVWTPRFHCWRVASVPPQGTKIPQAAWRSQKKKNWD